VVCVHPQWDPPLACSFDDCNTPGVTVTEGARTLYRGSRARLDKLPLGRLAAGASVRLRVRIPLAAGMTPAVQGAQVQVATRWVADVA